MEFEKSSIERLKRTLYSRNEKVVPKEKRTPVSGRNVDVPTNWGTKLSFDDPNDYMTKKTNSFFNKFLLGSFVFFFIALIVALFIFFGGMNLISSDNLDLEITAPSSTSSGEEFIIELSLINNNRTDLEEVSLLVDYPDGALSVGGNKALSRENISVGTIVSGNSQNYTVRAVLSGEKDTIKTFKFNIEYKVKGSNAVFSKEKTFDVVISSSPIILEVTPLGEINSGQEVTLFIDITSNSNVVMKNSLIKVEYPYGFTYKSSSMTPVEDNSVWNMGDLKSGDKKTLSIVGVLIGQDLEERTFKISSGMQKAGSVSDMDTILATNSTTVEIRKSSFGLSVDTDSVSTMGSNISVGIKYQNILPDKLLNTNIVATISGNMFDKTKIDIDDGGYYRSSNNTITWDKNSTANLASVSPGASGDISFSVGSFSDSIQTKSIKNPHIDINVKSTGDRSGIETGEVVSSADFTIKFPSSITLTAKALRSAGAFTNTGPVPPKADIESTYTVVWTLTNANNDLGSVVVTGALPAGVAWKNEISPSSENISFDLDTRVISWYIGNVSSGTGFTYSPDEISFKVGIIPNINQIGSIPDLVSGIYVSAIDTYTETQVTYESRSVTTQYSDAGYTDGNGTVKK
jgi:hypothetical protein